MTFATLKWKVTVFIVTICLGASWCDIVEKDVPCQNQPFTGSPANTMYPHKGKELVEKGRTLKQEAVQRPILQRAIASAETSPRFKGPVSSYGKNMGLDGNETLAIFCYSLDNMSPTLHEDFNRALRTGDESAYPVFHYYLDSGIRKLAAKQGLSKRRVYRGSSLYFTFSMKETTFPGFTSTSLKREAAKQFWRKGCTMFEMTTRFGADIKELSQFPNEDEILIPPYEIFSVGSYGSVDGMPTMTMTSVLILGDKRNRLHA